MMPDTINMGGSVAPPTALRDSEMGGGRKRFGVLNITPVIVCHCFGVSDRRILAEAGLGASDAGDVARRCGAGSDCGGCTNRIEDLLEIRPVGEPADAAMAS